MEINVDAFAALAGDRYEHLAPLKTWGLVTLDLFAESLGIVKTSLHSRLRRHPGDFPEPVSLPGGSRLYFKLDDLKNWSAGFAPGRCPPAREKIVRSKVRGRPTKKEVMAAAAAGLSVRDWRLLGRGDWQGEGGK